MLYDGKFIEAALLCFENNYTQLFIKTVNRLFNSFDEIEAGKEVNFDDEKLMIAEEEEAKVNPK